MRLLISLGLSLVVLTCGNAMAQQQLPVKPEYSVAYGLEVQLNNYEKKCGTNANYQAAVKKFNAKNPGYAQAVKDKNKDPQFIKYKPQIDASLKQMQASTPAMNMGLSGAEECAALASSLEYLSYEDTLKMTKQMMQSQGKK